MWYDKKQKFIVVVRASSCGSQKLTIRSRPSDLSPEVVMKEPVLFIAAGTGEERLALARLMEKGIQTAGVEENGKHWVFRSRSSVLVCALGAALVGKYGVEEAVRIEAEASRNGARIPNRGIRASLGICYDLYAEIDSLHQFGTSVRAIITALSRA
jgi:hypothetical protein